MKEKTLLINPSLEVIPPSHIFSTQPYSLLKIGKYLKEEGNNVKLIDCLENINYLLIKKNNFREKKPIRFAKCGLNGTREKPVYLIGKSYDELKYLLIKKKYNPDRIFISTSMTYYYRSVFNTIKLCKEVYPNASIEIGGIYPTLCPDHAKKSGADIVHSGLYKNKILFETDLSFYNKKPNYSIIKFTRGCQNKCSYCAVSILEGNKVVVRDLEDVINEIKFITKKYRIKAFHLWESSILVKNKHFLKELLIKLIDEKLKIILYLPEGLQIDLIDEELVDLLAKAGIRYIHLPLESSNIEVNNKRFHRQLNLEKLKYVIKLFKNHNITVRLFCLIGMPNQSLEEILKSILFCWKNECETKIMNFTPIPGTEEYINHKELLKSKDLSELDPALYPFINDDMIEIMDYIFDNFDHQYINPHSLKFWPNENIAISTLKQMIDDKELVEVKNPINLIADKFKCFSIMEKILLSYKFNLLNIEDNSKEIILTISDLIEKIRYRIGFNYKKDISSYYKKSKNFYIYYKEKSINKKTEKLIDLIIHEDNR